MFVSLYLQILNFTHIIFLNVITILKGVGVLTLLAKEKTLSAI